MADAQRDDDDARKDFLTPRSTASTRFAGTFGGGSTFSACSDFRRPVSRSFDEYRNTVSPRFLRGLRLPPMEYKPPREETGLKHMLEEIPSKFFLDDERYSRREVLEENVIDAEMLKRIDFFRNFGPSFLEELLSAEEGIRKVVMMPNTVLVREGAPGDSMMVISKGKVAVSVNGKVVKHFGEGSYFGELVFLGAARLRTATVTTVTFCDVRIIYNKTFKQIAAKYPEVQAALAKFDSAVDIKGSAKSKAKTSKMLAETLAGVFRSIGGGDKGASSSDHL